MSNSPFMLKPEARLTVREGVIGWLGKGLMPRALEGICQTASYNGLRKEPNSCVLVIGKKASTSRKSTGKLFHMANMQVTAVTRSHARVVARK